MLILANYHILARTFSYVPHLSPTSPGRIPTTLATLTAAVEAPRAYLNFRAAGDPSSYAARGLRLTRVSLALQLTSIALFYALAARFHYRVAGVDRRYYPRIRAVLRTLYVSMLLLLVRTVYRAAVHCGGADGYAFWSGESRGGPTRELSLVAREELFVWLLEGGPMLLNVAIWNVRHPRQYLPRPCCETYLARDGKTEVEGPGLVEKRET
ncbi:hypothetical protein VTI74DRAFT_6079 [Chaetomium olivicolor]